MSVSTKIDDRGLGIVEFQDPSHNSLSSADLRDLEAGINKLSEDKSCKLILLKSGGKRTFCAGASLTELKSLKKQKDAVEFFSGFARVINACRNSSKLLVGRIQGKAIGGGVGLAAACDYCIATRHASIRLSELNIGIGPFVISPAVIRKIGLGAFSSLTLNPDMLYPATWARDKDLFNEVHPTTEAMDKALGLVVDRMLGHSQDALSSLKKTLWRDTDHWNDLLKDLAKTSGKLVLKEEAQDALAKL